MNLVVPGVGTEAGPQYATDINSSLAIIDGHNHSIGSGVQITPNGLNINASLPMNGNYLTSTGSITFTSQVTPIAAANNLYEVVNDLWFTNGSGLPIQITNGSGINVTSSGIASGTASASFVGGVLVVNSAANTPAAIQGGPISIGNIIASSNFITLQAPNALGSNQSITLPQTPSVASVVTMDTSGNMATANATGFSLPAGMMAPYGGAVTPSGWLLCNGAAVSRTVYANLFAAIGTGWGSGDGSTTFNIPQTQGVFLRGVDNGQMNDPDTLTRTAIQPGGNSGDNVGSYQGWQIQSHNHTLSDPTHHHTYAAPNGGSGGGSASGTTGQAPATNTSSSATGITIAATGGNQTNPNNVYVNYIIKT